MAPANYGRIAPRYDAGRDLPEAAYDQWRKALEPLLEDRSRTLDLGAGTGLWAARFAEWFDGDVIALEPAVAMIQYARTRRHSNIHLVCAAGEAIPLRENSCDAAWLSTVVHHLSDSAMCAAELRRVLRYPGAVLVRNAFSGRAGGITWLRYFPDVRPRAEARWPSLDSVVETFTHSGFHLESMTPVAQVSAPDWGTYLQKIRERADSTLAESSDEQFRKGLEALEKDINEGAVTGPVEDVLDLLVFR